MSIKITEVFLFLWDRFFGTYCEERDDLKPVYGTVKALRSWNPYGQILKYLLIWRKTHTVQKIER